MRTKLVRLIAALLLAAPPVALALPPCPGSPAVDVAPELLGQTLALPVSPLVECTEAGSYVCAGTRCEINAFEPWGCVHAWPPADGLMLTYRFTSGRERRRVDVELGPGCYEAPCRGFVSRVLVPSLSALRTFTYDAAGPGPKIFADGLETSDLGAWSTVHE